MAFIITDHTDDRRVRYGYCSRCLTYNEVWREKKRTRCQKCDRLMLHIPSKFMRVIAWVILVGLLVAHIKFC